MNMIDKVDLENRVRECAQLHLSDIANMSEAELKVNLKLFAEECKNIAEDILEQYIFATVTKYTEGPWAINDQDILSAFCNFNSGYQHQMLEWIKTHPLEVREEVFQFPQKPVEEDRNITPQPKTLLVGGTVIAIGLFIVSNIWIALAAELLSLIAAKVQSIRIKKSEKQRESALKHYRCALEDQRNRLVNGLTDDLSKWLDLGVDHSNEILAAYDIVQPSPTSKQSSNHGKI